MEKWKQLVKLRFESVTKFVKWPNSKLWKNIYTRYLIWSRFLFFFYGSGLKLNFFLLFEHTHRRNKTFNLNFITKRKRPPDFSTNYIPNWWNLRRSCYARNEIIKRFRILSTRARGSIVRSRHTIHSHWQSHLQDDSRIPNIAYGIRTSAAVFLEAALTKRGDCSQLSVTWRALNWNFHNGEIKRSR